MPGNEFSALEKVTGYANKKMSQVKAWSKNVDWDIANDLGDNPFSGLKTLVDVNKAYKEAVAGLSSADMNDPKDEKTRKMKTSNNASIQALNMNYYLQRNLISKNYVTLIKPFIEQVSQADQMEDSPQKTNEMKKLQSEITSMLNEFKVDKKYSGNQQQGSQYMLDLLHYLVDVYSIEYRKANSKYKAAKKKYEELSEEEKGSFKDTMKSVAKFASGLSFAEGVAKVGKAAIEKGKQIKENIQKPVGEEGKTGEEEVKEEKKDINEFFNKESNKDLKKDELAVEAGSGEEEKGEDSLSTEAPKTKKVRLRIFSKSKKK